MLFPKKVEIKDKNLFLIVSKGFKESINMEIPTKDNEIIVERYHFFFPKNKNKLLITAIKIDKRKILEPLAVPQITKTKKKKKWMILFHIFLEVKKK